MHPSQSTGSAHTRTNAGANGRPATNSPSLRPRSRFLVRSPHSRTRRLSPPNARTSSPTIPSPPVHDARAERARAVSASNEFTSWLQSIENERRAAESAHAAAGVPPPPAPVVPEKAAPTQLAPVVPAKAAPVAPPQPVQAAARPAQPVSVVPTKVADVAPTPPPPAAPTQPAPVARAEPAPAPPAPPAPVIAAKAPPAPVKSAPAAVAPPAPTPPAPPSSVVPTKAPSPSPPAPSAPVVPAKTPVPPPPQPPKAVQLKTPPPPAQAPPVVPTQPAAVMTKPAPAQAPPAVPAPAPPAPPAPVVPVKAPPGAPAQPPLALSTPPLSAAPVQSAPVVATPPAPVVTPAAAAPAKATPPSKQASRGASSASSHADDDDVEKTDVSQPPVAPDEPHVETKGNTPYSSTPASRHESSASEAEGSNASDGSGSDSSDASDVSDPSRADTSKASEASEASKKSSRPPSKAPPPPPSPTARRTILPTIKVRVPVPLEDPKAHRARVVYASNEFVRVVPYAFSYVRWLLYVFLVIASGGLLVIVSVWFPQVFTHLARIRLPASCVGDAHFMLVLVQQDEFGSNWVEVPVHRSPEPPRPLSWWRRWLCCCCGPKQSTDAEAISKFDDKQQVRPWIWFEFKKHRYVFNPEKGEFERYLAKVKDTLERMRMRMDVGLDTATVDDKRELFGRNLVDIDPPFIPMLLFTKVVHPYYLFQVFSSAVWFAQGYSIYAATILVLSAISMAWEIYSEVANCNSLRELVMSDHEVHVFRTEPSVLQAEASKRPSELVNHEPQSIHERDLVPGDVVEIGPGPVVADMLLLSGSCVADEASLTGEAVPINKEAAQNGSDAITDTEAQISFKTSFLHAGSSVTRVREAVGPCRAVVLSTGFATGKGELFRSILFPRAISFEFERDSYRYLAVLATIAIAAFIKRLVNFTAQGYGIGYSIVNSLDLITIAVPPALPLVLSSGIGFALKRLAQRGIFCIDAQRINSCGQLNTYCFDKTGTLTEESMTFVGFDSVGNSARLETGAHLDGLDRLVRLGMATCHSLSDTDGVIQGSPLELAMFAAAQLETTSYYDEAAQTEVKVVSDGSGRCFKVLKRFPFDAACQRSSVVIEDVESHERLVFVKGSPEAIHEIATVVPEGAGQRTLRYAADGKYCIAFSVRTLSDSDADVDIHDRTSVEAHVNVMGIALFHNELKPESKAVLSELYAADMDVRMITGDNALTAVHVAKLLGMPLHKGRVAVVDVNDSSDVVYHCMDKLQTTDTEQWKHLTNANVARVLAKYDVAVTGAAIEQLRLDLSVDSLKQMLLQTQIFARIRPTQKSWIVERLMDYGKIVGMCGDGTNDCGALKAAHVGLALSSAEASIVAPFTSKAKAVSDVPVLIREGRCALTTSFLGFKFMVLYPVIQLGMASTLGHFGTMLSNNQYIWDDLAIVLGLAITMLYTASSTKLSKERPPYTLFSRPIVLSLVGQIVLFVGLFAAMFAILNAQPWFCRRADGMKVAEYAMRAPTNLAYLSPTVVRNCAFNLDYLADVQELVDDIPVSHEGASVWLFGHMQYFCVALAFNLKDRFRLPFHTNLSFTLLFLAGLGVNLWFLLDTSGTIDKTFQSLPLPQDYRLMMLGMFAAHLVLALVWEAFATGAFVQWKEEWAERRQARLQAPMTPKENAEDDAIEVVVENKAEAEEVQAADAEQDQTDAVVPTGDELEKDESAGALEEGVAEELAATPEASETATSPDEPPQPEEPQAQEVEVVEVAEQATDA